MKAGIGMSEVVRADTGMTIDRAMTAEILSKALGISAGIHVLEYAMNTILRALQLLNICIMVYLRAALPLYAKPMNE